MRFVAVPLTIMFVALLSGCEATVEYVIVDEREILGEVYTESTSPIDNSVGTTDLIQDIPVVRQFDPQITVNLRPDSRLDERDVEERILQEYFAAGVEDQKNCTIPVSVPPGSMHVIEIQWTEAQRQGRIEEGRAGGGDVLGDYTIITDLRCEVVGVTVQR
jgi:hypothetical protein